jgi:hypothetical protein
MTTTTDAPAPMRSSGRVAVSGDHRGSWVPNGAMIAARFKELRKRRGLMIALIAVIIGLPALYLAIRLILHATDPHTYGPAGGYEQYVALVAGVLYLFGFILAATLGTTAGSADLTEGMFRHHVITGRSRIGLYLARIPAGLAIIGPLVAIGFTIVCAVCVFAAPTSFNYNDVKIPAQLSLPALEHWAADHAEEVVQNFPLQFSGPPPNGGACLPGPGSGPVPGPGGGARTFKGFAPSTTPCTSADLRATAITVAKADYSDYARQFLYPSDSLMIKSGLWLELEAFIGFMIGLGLSSLLGQRTIAVVLMIVLEVIVTPIAARAKLPHMIDIQRSVVGVATAHLEPGGLPTPFGGGSPADQSVFLHESTTFAVCAIVGWIVVWTALGAWRMMTRDA